LNFSNDFDDFDMYNTYDMRDYRCNCKDYIEKGGVKPSIAPIQFKREKSPSKTIWCTELYYV